MDDLLRATRKKVRRPRSARQQAWANSAEFAAFGRAGGEQGRRIQAAGPVCGAKRRSDGLPCQATPMPGRARCRSHGGCVPRGDSWHRVQAASSVAKADRKMRDLERRRKKREARLSAMSPDERKEFLRRSNLMKPGTMMEREQRKRDRALSKELAKRRSQPPEPVDPEITALDFQITELEAEIAARLKDGAND